MHDDGAAKLAAPLALVLRAHRAPAGFVHFVTAVRSKARRSSAGKLRQRLHVTSSARVAYGPGHLCEQREPRSPWVEGA